MVNRRALIVPTTSAASTSARTLPNIPPLSRWASIDHTHAQLAEMFLADGYVLGCRLVIRS